MHYVTRKSHRMQKHKFYITCPSALFMETILGPPKHEILCIDILCPGRIRMRYVTRRSHQMQKHKFNIMCPGAFFIESVLVPPEHEK
jgi:hypothetical protein